MACNNSDLVKQRPELRVGRVGGVAPELDLVLVGRESVQRGRPVGEPARPEDLARPPRDDAAHRGARLRLELAPQRQEG